MVDCIDHILQKWKCKLEYTDKHTQCDSFPYYTITILPFSNIHGLYGNTHTVTTMGIDRFENDWDIRSYTANGGQYQIIVCATKKEHLLPDTKEDRNELIRFDVKFLIRKVISETHTETIIESSNIGNRTFYYDWNGGIRYPVKSFKALYPIREEEEE
jgi:hypothetical protein